MTLQPPLTPRWLKLKAAGRYVAMGQKRLVQLAEDGQVRGFRDPGSKRHDWIFDRYSLDEYRLAQAGDAKLEERALDIMASVGVRNSA